MEALRLELGIIISAISQVLSIKVVFITLIGTFLGLYVGIIPGLTATMAVALLIGLTFKLPILLALGLLIGIYVGAIYAGGLTAILINIPGTPAAAATCLDGHPLAKRGKASLAIGIVTVSSFMGEIFGETITIMFIPIISYIALNFGSWEIFLLAIIGVLICGGLSSSKNPLKGWITGFLGLLFALIGTDEIYGTSRLCFGIYSLMGGIGYLPPLIGLFGFSEAFIMLKKNMLSVRPLTNVEYNKSLLFRIKEVLTIIKKHIKLVLRSGLIGVVIGAIPGLGETVSCWVSYDSAKRSSKYPEKFGTGSYEGLISAETANNATSGGALIPTLILGIPGGAVTALLLAALFLHGVRPGPMLRIENPEIIYQIVFMFYIAAIGMLVYGFTLAPFIAKVIYVPKEILAPMVIIFCVIGAYGTDITIFNTYIALIFGIIGFILKELEYPVAPMVLGIILGNMVDVNFRRTIMISNGSINFILSRPIGIVLLFVFALWVFSLLMNFKKKTKKN